MCLAQISVVDPEPGQVEIGDGDVIAGRRLFDRHALRTVWPPTNAGFPIVPHQLVVRVACPVFGQLRVIDVILGDDNLVVQRLCACLGGLQSGLRADQPRSCLGEFFCAGTCLQVSQLGSRAVDCGLGAGQFFSARPGQQVI